MEPRVFSALQKVRSYDCDYYGHVNNARYLTYLEMGRFEMLEELGLDLAEFRAQGYIILLRRVEIDYRYPAELGDQLVIETYLESYRRASGIFNQTILRKRDKKLIAQALVNFVFVNKKGRPVAIPDDFRRAFDMD